MDFRKAYNDATKDKAGFVIPVIITVYEDRSFTFILKEPPAAVLVKKKINLKKGSAVPHLEKVGKINEQQLQEVAEQKMPDLNANDIEAAKNIIAGTARSMGVVVFDLADGTPRVFVPFLINENKQRHSNEPR